MHRLRHVLLRLPLPLVLVAVVLVVIQIVVPHTTVFPRAVTDTISRIQLLVMPASQTTSFNQVVTVERGNLIATMTSTGEVYAPRQAELGFDVNKIELIELNVTPGQQVRAGDVLARIDPTTLERAVTQAEADLTVAQDGLEQAKDPYTELDLAQAQLAVTQAEADLMVAQDGLEQAKAPYSELDLAQAQLAVTQAKADLAEARQNLADAVEPSVCTYQSVVDLEYQYAWYEDNYYQMAQQFDAGEISREEMDKHEANLQWAEDRLNEALQCPPGPEDVAVCKNDYTWYQDRYAEMEGRYNAGEISQEQLFALWDRLQAAKDRLDQAQQAASTVTKDQNQVLQAEYNLQKAQATLAEIQAVPDSAATDQSPDSAATDQAQQADPEVIKAQNQVLQAEYNLQKAQATLAEIEAGPDPKEIEVAQAKVVSAQSTLETAQAALEAATLTAPFDGTIISVGAEVGDLVSSNDVVVTLSDLSALRVRAIVDETDISQVDVGQEVEITFDAFPGRRFRGQVLEVPYQGTLAQNIVTYEVPISLEGAEGVSLKPGMTANLSIVLARRQNVLLIPAMAVQQGEEGNVVMVQDSPERQMATPVEVGFSDGVYVEVVRGLNEGDHVVIEYQPSQEQPNDFRGGGNSFPGGGGSSFPGGGGRTRP
jgi:multidrug efflux pump subunit AcrA (membrane-fusion protein)